MILYVFDLVGTFAFAAYGAHQAHRKHLDLLGTFFCAGLTALGGGTIRELILHGQPAFLRNVAYVLAVGAGALFAMGLDRSFAQLNRYLVVLDGIGLVTFAYLGAVRAHQEGLGLTGMLLCAALTGGGGGVICDLITRRTPTVFYGDFYLVPALVMGLLAYLLRARIQHPVVVAGLFAVVFALHLSAVFLRWRIWRPRRPVTWARQVQTVRYSRTELLTPAWNAPTQRTWSRLNVRRQDEPDTVAYGPRPEDAGPRPAGESTGTTFTGRASRWAPPPPRS